MRTEWLYALQLTYLRIRHQKPELVWEISPNWGYSTIFLLSALKDNKAGQLISFDTWDGPGQNDCVQQVEPDTEPLRHENALILTRPILRTSVLQKGCGVLSGLWALVLAQAHHP